MAPRGSRQSKFSNDASTNKFLEAIPQSRRSRAESRRSRAAPGPMRGSMMTEVMSASQKAATFIDTANPWSPRKASLPTQEDINWDALTLSERIAYVMNHQNLERTVGVIILVNVAVIALETDCRSTLTIGSDILGEDKVAAARETLAGVEVVSTLLSITYAVEVALRLFAMRWTFFSVSWNNLDFFLVTFDTAGFILTFGLTMNPSLLRALRMVRLLRVSRTFIAFRELYSLVSGLTHCFKTLIRASVLMFLALTMWSILAVEYLRPLAINFDWGDNCTWCSNGFDNVMTSNLTFFQIVTGDGWSLLARPLIDMNVWVAFLFVSVIIVVVFGLLNLIIAAIIDAAAKAHDMDIEVLSQYASEARDGVWTCFRDMCIELDKNKDGGIGLDELRRGLQTNQNLRDQFSVMGIEEDDMADLLLLLDQDGSGDLSYQEFHSQLYKMKTLEPKTQLFYITRYVQSIQQKLKTLEDHRRTSDTMGPTAAASLKAASSGGTLGESSKSATIQATAIWESVAPVTQDDSICSGSRMSSKGRSPIETLPAAGGVFVEVSGQVEAPTWECGNVAEQKANCVASPPQLGFQNSQECAQAAGKGANGASATLQLGFQDFYGRTTAAAPFLREAPTWECGHVAEQKANCVASPPQLGFQNSEECAQAEGKGAKGAGAALQLGFQDFYGRTTAAAPFLKEVVPCFDDVACERTADNGNTDLEIGDYDKVWNEGTEVKFQVNLDAVHLDLFKMSV